MDMWNAVIELIEFEEIKMPKMVLITTFTKLTAQTATLYINMNMQIEPCPTGKKQEIGASKNA